MAAHFTATVARIQRRSASLTQVWLDVPAAVQEAFHAPGQYHHLSVHEGDESPFAIASAPGAAHFEYVVRDGGSVADALVRTRPGDTVHVTKPEGPGFPLHEGRGQALLLIGTGTGFAPLRAALTAVLQERSAFGHLTALYGARAEDELVFAEDFVAWVRAGVDVVPTLTAPSATWTGRVGRVQAHLDALKSHQGPVFVCGQRALVDDVRARFGRVFTNV